MGGTVRRVALTLLAGLALLSAAVEVSAEPAVAPGPPASAAPWRWQLSPGFIEPPVPADNPMSVAKVALGARLFAEPRLSVTGTYSCASCHEPARAYTDGRPVAIGATGSALRRNAPSILYSAWNPALGWDAPGSATLEQQMQVPLRGEHPVELGLAGIEDRKAAELAADPDYASAFAAAFPEAAQPVSFDNIVRAIAAFERSLVRADSAFDRFVFGAAGDDMSAPARRGMRLFFGKAGCASCHQGITFSGTGFATNGHAGERRSVVRVPSLRNVAVTAPYMRDGAVPTLAAVIDHYARGNLRTSPPLPRLRLSRLDKADLQAFLLSLTDRPWAAPAISRP